MFYSKQQPINKTYFLRYKRIIKYLIEIMFTYLFLHFYFSGGQARRVSLAISLLHDPKLIVLDEPTVGIDPLLRQE